MAAVAGSPVLGSAILYWWPPVDEDWQLGRVRRRSRKAPFTHVVGYRLATAAFVGSNRFWTRPRTVPVRDYVVPERHYRQSLEYW